MKKLLVLEQSVDDYLTLVTKVTLLNENHIESLMNFVLGSYLLIIIIHGLLMNGKMLFLQMNLVLSFSTAKNRTFVRRLPLKADASFNFQSRVQGGGGSISVWGMMTAKGVGPLVLYDGLLDDPIYINIIKNHLLSYIKNSFKQNDDRWYYVQDNGPCHKSAFAMKWL